MGKRVIELTATSSPQDADVLLIDNPNYIASKKVSIADLVAAILDKVPSYVLKMANSTELGGIKADAKTDADNIPVKIDPTTGKAFVAPVNKITITDNGDGTVNIDVS